MNVIKFINNLYSKKKYIDSYGDCIAISVVIIALYGLSSGYFYILANIKNCYLDLKITYF